MMRHKRILALVAGGVLIGGILFCQFACKKEIISAKELKQQFGETRESLAPVYNVGQDDTLCFQFELDYTYIEDLRVDGLEMLSVHIAPTCREDSKVECYVWEEEMEGKTTVYASPVMPAFATESLTDAEEVWGCAPIYYVCLRYDMNSREPQKLDAPIVIPFTVESQCEVPNVMGRVDEKGCLILSWDAIEGADSYNIYQQYGEDIWIEKVADTTETTYDALWIAEEGVQASYQNQGVSGSYYVTARVGDKESNLSAAVDTAELQLPQSFDETFLPGQLYESVEKLPDKLQIVNTDGSLMWRPVCYTLVSEEGYVGYEFAVEGTLLGGMVYVEKQEESAPAIIENDSGFVYLDKNTQLNKVPSMAVKSVLAQAETESLGDVSGGSIDFYEAAWSQTQQWITEGENITVSKPVKGCKVFADNAEEAWLCYHLLAAEDEISLQAFPALLDPYVLEDTFLKVCRQNPYVLGVQSYYFDYEKLTLNIEYVYSKREISKRQKQLYQEATEIVSSIIKSEMSPEEKTEAIYLWLEDNCTYASEEWEYLKEQEFQKDDRWKEFEDANNAYGAIVEKEALCGGYAAAFQLLSYMADVKAIAVNGHLNGNVPHAWNMVYMEGAWYQLDCSSNGNTTGIPFYLYYADLESAQARGYVLGNDFATQRECALLLRQNGEKQREYYRANYLEVATVAEVEWLLTKYLEEDSISFRCTGLHLTEEELVGIVRKVYLKNGKEDALASLQYRQLGQYIVIYKK